MSAQELQKRLVDARQQGANIKKQIETARRSKEDTTCKSTVFVSLPSN